MSDKPTDAMQPWTIKSFPTALKATIIEAARIEGITVGAWLERLVNAWIGDGKPTRVHPENQVVNQVSAPQTTLLEAVQALAVLVHLPADDSLVKTAKSSTRAALTASRQASLSAGKTSSETRLPGSDQARITGSQTKLTALTPPPIEG